MAQRARHDEKRWKSASEELRALRVHVTAMEREWGLSLEDAAIGTIPPRLFAAREDECDKAEKSARQAEAGARAAEIEQLRSRLREVEPIVGALRRLDAAAAAMSGEDVNSLPAPQLPNYAGRVQSEDVVNGSDLAGGGISCDRETSTGAVIGVAGTHFRAVDASITSESALDLDPRWVRLRGLRRMLPGVAAAGAAMAKQLRR